MASGYDALLFQNEPAAAAVHESCSCSAPGAGSCAAVWVRKDVPSDFSPPLFGIDQIGTTSRIAAAGMFGTLRLFDTATGQLSDKGSEHGLRLTSGAFLENGIGCVAGQSFAIYRTTDSGDTFQQVLPAPPALPDVFAGWIRDIAFSSSGVNGVAVGDTGFTAWSNNAGASWTLAPQNFFNLQCVAFVPNTTHVLAAGVNGVLRRSTNFGVTWTGVSSPTTETIQAIAFADSQVGTMVGTNEAIFRTGDGGLTWSPVDAVDTDGISTDFHGVAAWSDGAIAVGSGGRVYESSAGGRFHHVDLSGLGMTASTLTDVQAIEQQGTVHVRACGTEGVMLFQDGGTWSLPKSQTSGIHVAVSFLEPDLGYGIGREFLVTKYE